MIAATNHTELLDQVMFQRLDDLVEYDLPEKKEIDAALKKLAAFKTSRILWTKAGLINQKNGLSCEPPGTLDISSLQTKY